jgi:hypothetical protein
MPLRRDIISNILNYQGIAVAKRNCIAVLLFLAVLSLGAQAPKSLKEIPLFAGAAAYTDPDDDPGSMDKRVTSYEFRTYTVDASIEDVAAWYRQKLGAKDGNKFPPAAMPPAKTSGPAYILSPYDADDSEFADGRDPVTNKKTYEGAWIRDTIKAKRQKFDGAWLKGCDFTWGYLDKEGRPHELEIALIDESFDAYTGRNRLPGQKSAFGKKDYRPLTSLRLVAQVTKSDAEREEESDAASDAEYAAAKARMSKAPTAKELGMPVYPGATYNLDASAGMTMDGNGFLVYVYLSGDTPEKAAAFYEKATGKKAEKLEKAYRVVLKGKGLFPDHFVSIEPNTMFGGSSKTVITVWVKAAEEGEED